MYYYRGPSYENISTNLLPILNNFSGLILTIEKLNDKLLQVKEFNQNQNFIKYINHFNNGRYFHFRCQGYMEALIQAKSYTPENICYWLNNLVFPAYSHFTDAFKYFDLAKEELFSLNNPDFKKLVDIVNELKRVANEIMKEIESYNLTC